ncbi:ArsR family transcriptional regulator [Streptomyces muensis]|uniref:Helix-turn-helix domain-containing protein n=1 Tax=Streptomyces muensis TaxID=1077944 RepID=A0A9X1PYS2_STRM4|nr:ArsR family transcriptional regulator [Streptomyces muensis]MCF1595471.1 helix-turn-helix domain-containing protein [Streptomyces muensis]
MAQIGFLLNFGLTAVGGGHLSDRALGKVSRSPDIALLMALRRERRDYVPGFMFAGADGHAALEEELHQVASAPAGLVARQMGRFMKSAQAGDRRESVELRRIAVALEGGERAFARRIADELGCFWTACVSARWSAMRPLMEADIRHRAASMAERGLAATLSSLHPGVSYESGTLRIQDAGVRDVSETRRIVLHPSPLVSTWQLRHDPWGEDGTHLSYPVRPGPKATLPAEAPAVADSLGKVIGQARLLLLSDLGSSRTTTELAERHHMSASTVSYHLTRMHRVGLLNRIREGSRVYYQRTPEADNLVTRRGCLQVTPHSSHTVLSPSAHASGLRRPRAKAATDRAVAEPLSSGCQAPVKDRTRS